MHRGFNQTSLRPTPAGSLSIQNFGMFQDVNGTFQALDLMASCVRGEVGPDYSGFRDPWIKELVDSLMGDEGIDGLFYFVRDRIAYTVHPTNIQRVQDCRRTIELGSGDCVSQSLCFATMAAAAGVWPKFVAQSTDGDQFDHVYVEIDGVAYDPIADGKQGRELASPGWRQKLPESGLETEQEIF